MHTFPILPNPLVTSLKLFNNTTPDENNDQLIKIQQTQMFSKVAERSYPHLFALHFNVTSDLLGHFQLVDAHSGYSGHITSCLQGQDTHTPACENISC